MDEQILRDHLIWAEGTGPVVNGRLMPYRDSEGILTIGHGRNIEEKGISRGEARFMLENDIQDTLRDCLLLPYWNTLSPVRKIVIMDMVFNLGLTKFLRFQRLNAALANSDYSLARAEMIDSKWHRQVGRRALRLEEAMITGVWK